MKVFAAAVGIASLFVNNVAVALASTVPSAEQSECATGVQIISARGTNQAPGIGSMSPLISAIMEKVPGSMAIGLGYPALFTPTYEASEDAGAKNMTNYIKYFAEKCPDTKQVLVGYSQGAQVTMDALCGSPSLKTGPLGSSYRDIIAAAIVYGDPSHTIGQHYNRGTSRHNGNIPRTTAGCQGWADKIASWCDIGDPYCDDGHIPAVHDGYHKYNGAALSWLTTVISSGGNHRYSGHQKE